LVPEEASVTEKSQACVVSCIGALAGAAVAYMLFTNHGRRLRRSVDSLVEDLALELDHFRGTVNRMAGVASGGWRLLNDALGEAGPAIRSSNPHQTSPF
jgi:hypothetical protein